MAMPSARRSYWALMCWLYAAPFAPMLRSAALHHDGSPLFYPVHGVLYGRSDGGKTIFARVIARSMFGIEQMPAFHRGAGLRDQLVRRSWFEQGRDRVGTLSYKTVREGIFVHGA